MVRKLLSLVAFILIATYSNAQRADEILGTWVSDDGNSHVKIYRKDDGIYGKLSWIKNERHPDGSIKKDDKNPDPAKRDRPLKGLVILKGLQWDAEDQEWNEGKIYDPKSGKTYDVFARLKGKDTLYMKGYVGISMLGRSTEWKRLE